MPGAPGLTGAEKERLLRALEEDREFRYALMGLLGFQEILARITRLEEQVTRLEERFARLEERFANLEERYLRLEERVTRVEERLEELSRAVRDLAAKVVALGHRYGLATEETFRSAVQYMLEDLLGEYEVRRWIYYDSEGIVFGHPSVVEVDLLVKDNIHVLVEYKSIADRADVAELHRIGLLYEKASGVRPRLLLVAPGYTRRARELAESLGVEIRGQPVD